MAPKKQKDAVAVFVAALDERDRRIVVNALQTAINSYEANEKTFRQVVEDLQNGKPVPMFAAGDAGIKTAKKLADGAYLQASDARDVMERMAVAEEGEAEAS